MINCDSLLKKTIQAFSKEKFSGKHIPLDGVIELTHRCNFRCLHCYGCQEREENDRSFDFWISVLDSLVDSGCLSLIYTGGEVLCRKDFLDIYKETRKRGIMVAVFSNASLLNEQIVKTFYEYPLSYFSTTMYGFSQETYHMVTGNPSAYNDFMRGLELLKKYQIPVEIKAIALKENLADIVDIHNFAKRNGYMFRCSSLIRATNNASATPISHAVDIDSAFKLDVEYFEERKKFWEQQALNPPEQPYTNQRRLSKCKYLCHYGEQSFLIDASGVVHGCVADRVNGFSLDSHTFNECWELIRQISNAKVETTFPCLECEHFRFCEQCTAALELDNSDLSNINSDRCKLARMRHQWCDQYVRKVNNQGI